MKIPLVLLPGLLSDMRLWEHQNRYLSDIASIQVISSIQNTSEEMIRNILKQAPPKFALAGHSMGGWLCLEIMRTAPDRVSQLCLLNTTARMDSEEKRMRRNTMIQKVEQGLFQEVVSQLVDHFVVNSLVKRHVENMFFKQGGKSFVCQEQAMIKRNESKSVLSMIRCPVLVIHASQDPVFTLEEHKELVRGIKNAKLAIVEDSGHMSPMEMPQAITALLRYWLTYPGSIE